MALQYRYLVADLPAFIKSEIVRWSGVVEQAGLAGTP